MKKDKPLTTVQSKSSLSPSAKERHQPKQEDYLVFLKGKLVDLHNRLMEQLDICKEQYKRILELNQENEYLREAIPYSPVDNDKLVEQLEVTRARLKTTEVERNRFRQELQFLAQKYTELEEVHSSTSKKMKTEEAGEQQFKKRLAGAEAYTHKLKKQLEEVEAYRGSYKRQISDLDKSLKQEKEVNRTLTEVNKELQAKLFNMVIKSESLEEENAELRSNKSQSSKDTNKEVERMRKEIHQLQTQLRESERAAQQSEKVHQAEKPAHLDRSPSKKSTTPRRTFDETQYLIRRLEQAEEMTRNRNTKSINKLHTKKRSDYENPFQNRYLTFENDSYYQPRRIRY